MTLRRPDGRLGASFRDPSGHVFSRGGTIYRTVNDHYRDEYAAVLASGLFEELISKRLLIPHEEVEVAPPGDGADVYRVLRPERIPFISYPYEWSFSQLKDAALLTLDVARRALARGIVLKDASAYNVQFVGCHAIFIDTLSFERYEDGAPWVGYRQFCQHFLAPLALMAKVDVRLGRMQRTHLDGIPLDLAASLLPGRTFVNPGLLMHIHAHARVQGHVADKSSAARDRRIGKTALFGLIESLRAAVAKLEWRPAGTEWAEYYEATNYSPEAMASKEAMVRRHVARLRPATVWDLGANLGRFSRLCAEEGAYTVAMDIDPAAVEKDYVDGRACDRPDVLPLVMDLTDPSPGSGWALAERDGLFGRGAPDVVLALALVHHLAISNNVPLGDIAALFARIAPHAIVEFVPKSDSQVQRLLASRRDVFSGYHERGFEQAFGEAFTVRSKEPVPGTERTLYVLERRDGAVGDEGT